MVFQIEIKSLNPHFDLLGFFPTTSSSGELLIKMTFFVIILSKERQLRPSKGDKTLSLSRF